MKKAKAAVVLGQSTLANATCLMQSLTNDPAWAKSNSVANVSELLALMDGVAGALATQGNWLAGK